MNTKKDNLQRRRARARAKIQGVENAPRLSVYISNKHVYVQAIDDEKTHTVASSSDKTITEASNLSKKEKANIVGRDIAEKLQKVNHVTKVIFDRGGRRYAGNIKILADAARKAGLKF